MTWNNDRDIPNSSNRDITSFEIQTGDISTPPNRASLTIYAEDRKKKVHDEIFYNFIIL
jgi:hypothetical protein